MPSLASDSDAIAYAVTDALIHALRYPKCDAYGQPHAHPDPLCICDPFADADDPACPNCHPYPIADTAPDSAAERY